MENNKTELAELIQNWEKLRFEINKKRKIDFAVFDSTFSRTYSLLAQHATEDSIDKKYVELISTAFLFANIDCKELDSKYRAALVLTERMINCCAFNSTSEMLLGTSIYVFELRKDVYVNFNNINESINKLAKLFEEDYWRKL